MADEDKRATQPPPSSADAPPPSSRNVPPNKSGSFLKAKVERLSQPHPGDEEEETRIEKHPQRRKA